MGEKGTEEREREKEDGGQRRLAYGRHVNGERKRGAAKERDREAVKWRKREMER